MTKTKQTAAKNYRQAVGCMVNHRGEDGLVVAYLPDTYAVPMFVVQFDGRMAILKPSELGAA